ncbi:polysaccharide deacetylase family protein [Prolixibacteraceae bacterium Z1-6]|uniref:Polysaccharide deacetylase family protein n=1 Tax=Draconibacterium aestuarii TaxID=2998507 RepID=A0A9X3FHD1_9BACT|nr:polysaccharide deacetylase family protein [Prolixibacteraceae bacterium Z1-6]
MANFPRFFSKQIGRFLSEERLFSAKTPVFHPFYHVVSNKPLPHILNYPYLNEKQFEQELDYFLKYFVPVSLSDLYSNIHSAQKTFHLSFDDGLRECADIIAPILLKKGIPATFFVNSGFVDNKELFHRYKASLILTEMQNNPDSEAQHFLNKNNLNCSNILQAGFSQRELLNEAAELLELDFNAFLKEKKPYLTTQQIEDLHRKGFSIGGHSHKHPEFWKISEKKQLKQIRKSMEWVNEKINPEIKAFAFPFTDDGVPSELVKRLKKDNICDITFGTAGVKYDNIDSHFQRYPAEQKGDFRENLKAEFMYFKLRKITGKATVKH